MEAGAGKAQPIYKAGPPPEPVPVQAPPPVRPLAPYEGGQPQPTAASAASQTPHGAFGAPEVLPTPPPRASGAPLQPFDRYDELLSQATEAARTLEPPPGWWGRTKEKIGLVRRDLPAPLVALNRNRRVPEVVEWANLTRDQMLQARAFDQRIEQVERHIRSLVKTPADNALVAKLLDQGAEPGVFAQVQTQHPRVWEAYQLMRTTLLDHAHNPAVGLGEERILSNYFSHLFSPETTRSKLIHARDMLAKEGGGTPQELAAVDAQLAALSSQQDIVFSRLPSRIKADFLEQRTGAPGYEWDALRAFRLYNRRVGDKVYTEPVLEAFAQLQPRIRARDPALATYLADRLRHTLAPRAETFVMDILPRGIQTYEALTKLAGNLGWAQLNFSSGMLAGASTIGERAMGQGMALVTRSPAARKFFEDSGHAAVTTQSFVGGAIPQRAQSVVMAGATQIELAVRASTYLGSIWDKMGRPSVAEMEKIWGQGRSAIPLKVLYDANLAVEKSQGLYGPWFNPRWATEQWPKTLAQFTVTPAKVVQGLAEPRKLAGPLLKYAAYTEILEEVLRGTLGVDLTRALGVGVDFQGLARDFARQQESGKTSTQIVLDNTLQEHREGRGGIPSFGLGAVVSTAKTLSQLLEWTVKGLGLGEPTPPNKLEQVVERESTLGRRVLQAARSLKGGEPGEAARVMLAVPSDREKVQEYVIRQLKQGNRPAAQSAIRLWSTDHPGVELFPDPSVLDPYRETGPEYQREKDLYRRTQPVEEQQLRRFPPGTRRALEP